MATNFNDVAIWVPTPVLRYVCTVLYGLVAAGAYDFPTNIGIVRGTVSVATIVVVSAGVEIWLLLGSFIPLF